VTALIPRELHFAACTMPMVFPHLFVAARFCSSTETVEYHPSALESQWLKGAAGSICKLAVSQREASQQWLQFAKRAASTTSGQAPRWSAAGIANRSELTFHTLLPVEPTASERPLLSRFIRHGSSSRQSPKNHRSAEFIEPLTGIGRHPLTKLCEYNPHHSIGRGNLYDADFLFDISYLVLDNHCGADGRRDPRARCSAWSRNLFYDLGCSVFDDGEPLHLASGSGSGPSLPIFTRLYERRCIDFDAIYAWEAKAVDGPSWWKNAPLKMRAKLHFINAPIEELPSTQAPQWSGHRASFLALLNETASPDDFVAIKVDIEGQAGGPELPIVRAIAEQPELTRLVDEIFFEYHYYFDGIDFGWGPNIKALKEHQNVDAALQLMHQLRHAGVRSHFWI
jgi:hypothetical protein